ncbi:MAG: threonine/serine exporter family protein [Acidobacteria bacterium]|nr:threonine/serine exporter family protein [Acidobacteriota bacterium]
MDIDTESIQTLAVPAESRPEEEKVVAFAARLARALHRSGSPATRLEEVIGGIASRLGQEGNYLSLPTAFMASFGPFGRQNVVLVRVEPGDINLQKLVQLDEVADRVSSGKLDLDTGARLVEAVETARPPYGPVLTTFCTGVTSAATARFLGGGWREIAVSGVIGLLVGLMSIFFTRRRAIYRVFEPAAAFLASVLAVAAAWWIGSLSTSVTIVGGLIFLVPGFSFTIAMSELNSRHLMSGTGRLMGAFTTFMIIGLGVLLGGKVAVMLSLVSRGAGESIPLPWAEALAMAAGLLCLGIIFRAPPRDLHWILGIGSVAYATTRFGADPLGADVSTWLAALVLGLLSSAYSRLKRRPATVTLVPGLMLLVPGSMGLRSMLLMMDQNVMTGLDGAFQVAMMAVTLATGLLVADILLAPKKSL